MPRAEINQMEQEYEPKLSPIEGYALVALAAFFDLIDIILTVLDLLFGAGEFLKPFNNIIASSVLIFAVYWKGLGALRTIAGGALELIPFVNALPMRAVLMWITVHLDQNPGEAELAQTATRIVRPKRPATQPPSLS